MRESLLSINDKRWIKLADASLPSYLQTEKYSDIFKNILARKLNENTNVHQFLHPDIEDLYDPYLLKDMDRAVDRIQVAMSKGEKICIYGDYDVDGITSVSLLIKCFKQLQYPVEYYIPDRHDEGYGLNMTAIQTIRDSGVTVLITVDCGIASVAEAILSRKIGLDMIITDHHECQEEVPKAYAVINPKQPDCQYPFSMLAGVGLAYKLSMALLGELIIPIREELLELAAFGTIADIAPLVDENRIIAKHGLAALSQTKSLGMSALIACSDLKGKEITAGHVGFMLAPKINAAGRIDDPKLGVVLLTTENEAEAFEIAGILKDTNDKRQQLEKEIVDQAIQQIESREDFKEQHISIVQGEGWNSGVIGIVASRLVERFHKPAIVFSITDQKAKGSARSIDGFDIFEALCVFAPMFDKFGGHEQAAGLTVSLENFFDFKSQLETHCKMNLPQYLLTPGIKIDADVEVSQITYELVEELTLLEPFGMGNSRPVFRVENAQIRKKTQIGKNKEYTKFEIADGVRTFEAISFDKSGYYDLYKPGDTVDLVCHIDINEFRGTQTIQFQLKDIRGFREPLVKKNEAVSQFYFAEAHRVAAYAQKEECPPVIENHKIWTVDTLEGLYYFYNRIYDQVLSQLKVHINQFDSTFSSLNEETSDHLLICPLTDWGKGENVQSVESQFNLETGKISNSLYANWIPDRAALITFYKEVKENKYSDITPMSVEKWLCAMILGVAGLVQIERESVQILPTPNQKVDLEQVPLFRDLQSYKIALKNG